MQVQVRFLSYYRLIAGMESTLVPLPEDATVQELIRELKKQIPDLESKLPQTTILVNHRRATLETLLKNKDEISMLYLIGGG